MPIDPAIFKKLAANPQAKVETAKPSAAPPPPPMTVKPALPIPSKPASPATTTAVAKLIPSVLPLGKPQPPAVLMPDLGFKERLDELDRLCMSELGLSPYTIDTVRGHVKVIMTDLLQQPELDSILIDRDVHNVMKFIRYVKEDAQASKESITAKRETKAKKTSKTGMMLSILDKLPAMDIPSSIEDFSKLK
jgi:hypothetical protein